MHFKPEAMDKDLPQILRRFVRLAGREKWEKRLKWLEGEVRRETGMQHFWRSRCPLEFAFARVWRRYRRTGQVALRSANADDI